MAFENLILTTKRTINGIKIDGFIRENTVHKSRATRNPVENGVDITDHIILEPMEYNMDGVITNSPIGLEAFTEIGGAFDVGGIFGRSTPNGETRSQQVYLTLVGMQRNKDFITIESSIKVYDNLIMTSISVIQDKSNANSIFFTASFQEVFLVSIARSGTSPENITDDQGSAGLGSIQNDGVQTGALANESDTLLTTNSMRSGISL